MVDKYLDSVWAKIVKIKGYCERCYRKEELEAHHIYTRKNKSTRWDLNNGICLCTTCHKWWHKNPKEAQEWIKGKIGDSAFDVLRKKALSVKKWTDRDKENYLDELRIVHKELIGLQEK